MWDCVSNRLEAYADDTTLSAIIDSPERRAEVIDSLNTDLSNIVSWCEAWGMKLNPKKTQAIVFSRSRRTNPNFPSLVLINETLTVRHEIKILGVILDKKLTFEPHIRSICASLAQRIGILRKSLKQFGSLDLVRHCFYAFLLSVFEYCSPVWGSAAKCHLSLLDKTLSRIKSMIPNLNVDLWHRRRVSAMCVFNKILNNPRNPVHNLLPPPSCSRRITRNSRRMNCRSLEVIRCKTSQFQRTFVPTCVEIWNFLPEYLVGQSDLQHFKEGVNSFFLRHYPGN